MKLNDDNCNNLSNHLIPWYDWGLIKKKDLKTFINLILRLNLAKNMLLE